MNINWDLVGTVACCAAAIPFGIVVGLAAGRFVAALFDV